MKKTIKKYIPVFKSGFEIRRVSALINGIKHTFMRDKVFNDLGVEIK